MIDESFIENYKASYDMMLPDSMGKAGPLVGLTMGLVVSTDDPLQGGRLQIFCPAYGDDPKKPMALPWAAYISPYGGAVNNRDYVRGSHDKTSSDGAVHYGFWGIPELGANVLVGCVDGDPRRRFWVGCLPSHQETHTQFTGRFKYIGNRVEGPLTSYGRPLEPLSSNMKEAFSNMLSSPEWRSRGVDYQTAANRDDEGSQPNTDRGSNYMDDTYDKIKNTEIDPRARAALGDNGYDYSSFGNVKGMRASKVFGMSSPGMHAIFMDDRSYSNKIKIRSGSGHTILMDDANERIYIMTNKGKSYIEMDSSGNIDIFNERRLSVHSKKDINFTTDESFRVHAKKGIHLYAGESEEQDTLESEPMAGEIRLQAANDMHLISENVMRTFSASDTLSEIGGKKCESIGDSLFLQVQNDINIVTNLGDYNLTVSRDINEIAQGDINSFAVGNRRETTNGGFEMMSFTGDVNLGSQGMVHLQSYSADVILEAAGANPDDDGGIFFKSPESQGSISDKGILFSTNQSFRAKGRETLELEIGPSVEAPQGQPLPPQNLPDCDITPPIDLTGHTGIDLAARAAYNAGFRGDALVVAVAIAGGESSYNPNALGDQQLETDKWGPSYGFWQIRSLRRPQDYSFPDTLRLNDGTLYDPTKNAEAAYALSSGGTNWRPWSVFTAGIYQNFINVARTAVASMCEDEGVNSGPSPMLMSFVGSIPSSVLSDYSPIPALAAENSFKMSSTGIEMQSLQDIYMKSLNPIVAAGNYTINTMATTIDNMNYQLNLLSYYTSVGYGVISSAISGGISLPFSFDVSSITDIIFPDGIPSPLPSLGGSLPLPDLNINFDMFDMPNLNLPSLPNGVESIFYYANHDLVNGVI